ncbi:MAG: glycoside hydrolase family 88 protein [Schleiferilactobacillus harbinensis]|jgi:unsaturated chondroitin disaccharide hydrolase|nr:glycoside hydrolase family 88 protein [Schleiferilactobacillus harbinensis]MCI1913056.1 glycoside hydrolase family 88 protein [Schleiferilactobacillus harbinensis]
MANEVLALDQSTEWANTVLTKIDQKMQAVNQRNWDKIPYIVDHGQYVDMAQKSIYWWTNGFFAGSLWQLQQVTGNETYAQNAQKIEAHLKRALSGFTGLHHDVGFMYLHTAVADYRLTQRKESRISGLHAANLLAGRFNVNGQFIRSWNTPESMGWAIVDSLMNLPLLYWATNETGDPRFQEIAMRHADRLLECLVRTDGSVGHIAAFDPATGAFQGIVAGQGFDEKSAWARGQAWALYGYALSYRHTQQERYLTAAKNIAAFVIPKLQEEDYLSLVDYRAPYPNGKKYDASAGVCIACGLLELANWVTTAEAEAYQNAAVRILQATVDQWCDWDTQADGIVRMSSQSYHQQAETHVKLVYADYFFIEGILRLLDKDFLIW